MRKERTTITLPIGLRGKAHRAGINISGISAHAVLRALRKTKASALSAKSEAPATTSLRRAI